MVVQISTKNKHTYRFLEPVKCVCVEGSEVKSQLFFFQVQHINCEKCNWPPFTTAKVYISIQIESRKTARQIVR